MTTGQTTTSSTSGGGTGTSGSGKESEGSKETVSREAYEKVLREKENTQKRIRELEEQTTSSENSALEAKKEFEKLYQKERERAENLDKRLKGLEEGTKTQRKRDALTKELFALGLNEKLVDDALKLADLSTVVFDAETSTVVGAKDAAKQFHEKYQTLGLFKRTDSRQVANHSGVKSGGAAGGLSKPVAEMTQEEKMAELRRRHSS